VTAPHLDDEQLSLLLDGVDDDGRAHVEDDRCPTCTARLDRLRAARDAVARAAVAPLAADVLDRLVDRALAAPSAGEIVPIATARRRRITTPPPAWLLAAVAAIAVLVGVAGVVRAVDPSADGDTAASLAARDASSGAADAEAAKRGAGGATGSAADTSTAAAAGTAAAAPVSDPEVVVGDLGDQDDPATLAALLRTSEPAFTTTDEFAARPAAGGSAPTTTSGPPAPSAAAVGDRARCRAQAEAAGDGQLGPLLSTAVVRWKGQPAEVLVFRLAAPPSDGSLTRQALVLSRPGCAVLAEPRF
jgi:hypothetical protein